jgi:hypothetical protein
MSLSVVAIAKDLLTVASAVKVAAGAFLHKAYQYVVAKVQAAKAEAVKVEADVKADVTAVEKKL